MMNKICKEEQKRLSMTDKPQKTIDEIIKKDGRYPLDAVFFIQEALSLAVKKYYPDAHGIPDQPCHVSGPQLCHSLRELAQQRWGFMARMVLKRWNITSTRDFGEIVFLLVNNGWMQKKPTDCIDDFDDVYDFIKVFDDQFEISSDQ